jgi:hypothetical protein
MDLIIAFAVAFAVALVLDMRPASESLVCAAAVTTTLIQRIDRLICLSAQQLRQLAIFAAIRRAFAGFTPGAASKTERAASLNGRSIRQRGQGGR